MGRNIVLCFDGTSNKYSYANTNVVKLYALLDRQDPDQLSYYQPGIGTIPPVGMLGAVWKRVVKYADLAFAILLEQHVEDGYRFLMRYWQPGDHVYIFGFSRGAYTARVLAGMLHKVGLLTAGNEELIPFAWNMYRGKIGDKLYLDFASTFSRPVGIHFLGLWDTVSSVGLATHPESFQYTRGNPSVATVRHAVSLGERRRQFVQNLWVDPPPPGQDLKQVWFSGEHCDVGGGYYEFRSGLSKITLQWMVREAEAAGLRTNAAMVAKTFPAVSNEDQAAPDPAAEIHDSLSGLWWIVEYLPLPRKVAPVPPATKWTTRWQLHKGALRFVKNGAQVHESVRQRMQRVPDYKPGNLPQNPDWVD